MTGDRLPVMRPRCSFAQLWAPGRIDHDALDVWPHCGYNYLMNTTRYIARCKKCNRTTSALVEGSPASPRPYDLVDVGVVHYTANGWTTCYGMIALVCPCCGMARSAVAVRGEFSAKHVCSAKCMSSTGTTCECSCAGKNHGAAHAA